jgi:hypothetical protein
LLQDIKKERKKERNREICYGRVKVQGIKIKDSIDTLYSTLFGIACFMHFAPSPSESNNHGCRKLGRARSSYMLGRGDFSVLPGLVRTMLNELNAEKHT